MTRSPSVVHVAQLGTKSENSSVSTEKDPTALQLQAAYNGVPMPNLRLNTVDIDALLDYLDTESRRVASTR